MKTAASILIGLAASAGIAVAQNIPATNSSSSTTTNSSSIGIQGIYCTPRAKDGLWSWYYNSKAEGPYSCTTNHDTTEWSMLNAYRSGGTLGVHWKYTDNVNDGECLKDWKFYSADGQNLIATIWGRTTTVNDPRRWCALPVYRSGGVYDKQWADCYCQWE